MKRVAFNNTKSNRAVKFAWRYIGKSGVTRLVKVVPAGAIYRSSWRWVRGNTVTWVTSLTTHKRLLTERVEAPGNYGACSRINPGFTR